MTNETFHKLLKKMCVSAGIGCDKCPLNEPKKKAGCTCRKYQGSKDVVASRIWREMQD